MTALCGDGWEDYEDKTLGDVVQNTFWTSQESQWDSQRRMLLSFLGDLISKTGMNTSIS